MPASHITQKTKTLLSALALTLAAIAASPSASFAEPASGGNGYVADCPDVGGNSAFQDCHNDELEVKPRPEYVPPSTFPPPATVSSDPFSTEGGGDGGGGDGGGGGGGAGGGGRN